MKFLKIEFLTFFMVAISHQNVYVQDSTLAQFLIEAIVLSIAGGTFGTLLGITGNQIIYKFTNFHIPTEPYFIMIGFAVLVGVAFGYFSARKAAKLNQIDALRYE